MDIIKLDGGIIMIGKFRTCGIAVFISIILLLTSSCTQFLDNDMSKQSVGPAEIILTPTDLFKGEGEKFKNFLGAM